MEGESMRAIVKIGLSFLSLGLFLSVSQFSHSCCSGQETQSQEVVKNQQKKSAVKVSEVIGDRKPSKSKKVKSKPKPLKFYSYAEAYKLSKKENKPFVVIVTASWCPPCQAMKSTSIPELKRNGGLKGVIVALVDVDKERVLASQLTQGNNIPYTVVFEKKNKVWGRRAIAGYQSPVALKSFIHPPKALSTAAVEKIVR